MEPSETKHGQFSWNELVTNDPAAATNFYTQLFGWTAQEFPMPDFTYTVVSAAGANTGQGGIMPTPPSAQGMPPAWLSYVTVDSADSTAKRAEKRRESDVPSRRGQVESDELGLARPSLT